MTEPTPPLRFTGTVQVQFVVFLQSLMQTDADGSQAFVGIFGSPPNGTQFDAQVKLTVGAGVKEDAYEVYVHPAIGHLGAHPTLRKAALDYVNQSLAFMVGPNWREMTGLKATNNVIETPGALVSITFDDGSATW